MDKLPIAEKMVLYHIRDTTLSAGPLHRQPRFSIAMPISILLSVGALLYLAARVFG